MALSLGGKCTKYLLFTFNLLFVISGIILIIIGSVIKTPYSAYHYILYNGFFAIPVLLIFIGVIIFIVSFMGCCGAFKENYCLTVSFGVSLLLILIFEISGGIAGYVLKDTVASELKNDMLESVKLYDNTTDVGIFWNILQSNFNCCGVDGYVDWNRTPLPQSCCEQKNLVKKQCLPENVFKDGCYFQLQELLSSKAGALGGAGVGIAVIQILGMLCSYTLASSIKNQYDSLEKD